MFVNFVFRILLPSALSLFLSGYDRVRNPLQGGIWLL